jgi:hypothetical protein
MSLTPGHGVIFVAYDRQPLFLKLLDEEVLIVGDAYVAVLEFVAGNQTDVRTKNESYTSIRQFNATRIYQSNHKKSGLNRV